MPTTLSEREVRSNRRRGIAAKVLHTAALLIVVVRPAVLFPVGGVRCGFCFRPATGSVTYRNVGSGNQFTMAVCNTHRQTAPKRAGAGTLGYFKLMVWIVMLASSGLAFVTLGRFLYVIPPGPRAEFGAGCILLALLPMLVAQLLYLAGLQITGRVLGWSTVVTMLAASLALAVQPDEAEPAAA